MLMKPYAMSVCDLPGIGDRVCSPRPARRGTGGTSRSRRGAAVQSVERAPRRATACDAACRRRLTSEQRGRREPRAWNATRSPRVMRSTLVDRALRAAGRRDAPRRKAAPCSASTARTPGLSSSCRIAVMHLGPPFVDLVLGKGRPPRHVRHDREHVIEVFGQAGARERQRVAVDRRPVSATPRSSSASAMRFGRASLGAPVDDPPSEIRDALRDRRVVQAPGAERRADRDRRASSPSPGR